MSETIYLRVDPDLKRSVEEKLRDPITEGLPYGALSHLCRRLLIEWLEEQEQPTPRKRPSKA